MDLHDWKVIIKCEYFTIHPVYAGHKGIISFKLQMNIYAPIDAASIKNIIARIDGVITFAFPDMLICGPSASIYCLPRSLILPEVSINASACRHR